MLALVLLFFGAAITVAGLLPANGFVFFVTITGFTGLLAPLFNGPWMALYQEKVPAEKLVFAELLGVNKWFVIAGIATSLTAIPLIAFPECRNLDRQPV